MIKRLAIVGLFTGVAHLSNIFILKYLSTNISNDTISVIGEIDSLIILIVSIVSFGIQLSATRKIALMDDWKKEYYDTQSARLTLCLFLIIFSLSGFIVTKNILFLFSPIFALNGDYALYGRGKPELGAFVSLIRVIVPATTLFIVSIYWREQLIIIYVVSIIISYIIAGIIVSRSLKVSYFIKPNLKNLKKYWLHLGLGIASVLFLFIGISLVNVISFFYVSSTIAIIYIILKFYMIFKGVRQIIVQSFYKDLTKVAVALKVDQMATIGGLILFVSLAFFLDVITPVFFSEDFSSYQNTFFIIGLAGFVSSFTTSTGARLLLDDKDREYSRNIILAAGSTILASIVFYYTFGNQLYLIALSILFGEFLLSFLNVVAISEKKFLLNRFKSISSFLLISALFIVINSFIESSKLIYITFLFVMGVLTLVTNRNKLNVI
ncbi:hypothetical protein [Marixanthomonas spongiae]|uniref:O-antigen/teichoic acid export membrane protein n=1 Tax=Marixanthomonas spongiae TaxID=2174845 RepID=A0A2U0I2C1_9FLAO|nr:hypothetical protein [Marixanthomonas spongiae]PVW15140.1 hypothetical protein DDV96_06950 [Marixanthomonas spongiae]